MGCGGKPGQPHLLAMGSPLRCSGCENCAPPGERKLADEINRLRVEVETLRGILERSMERCTCGTCRVKKEDCPLACEIQRAQDAEELSAIRKREGEVLTRCLGWQKAMRNAEKVLRKNAESERDEARREHCREVGARMRTRTSPFELTRKDILYAAEALYGSEEAQRLFPEEEGEEDV